MYSVMWASLFHVWCVPFINRAVEKYLWKVLRRYLQFLWLFISACSGWDIFLTEQFPSLPDLVSFPAFQPWSSDSRCKLHCFSGVETSIETLFLSVGIPPGLVDPHSDLMFCTIVLKPGWPCCKIQWHAVVFVTAGDKWEIYPSGLHEESNLLSFRETTGSY